MLSLRVADDPDVLWSPSGFAAASATVSAAIHGDTPTTFPTSARPRSAVEWIEQLVADLSVTLGGTFRWGWERMSALGGARLVLYAPEAVDITVSASAAVLTGWGVGAHSNVTSLSSSSPAAGTLAPAQGNGCWSSRGWVATGAGDGDGAGGSGVRAPGFCAPLSKVQVTATGDNVDAARAALVNWTADTPRGGVLWVKHLGIWIPVSAGAITISASGRSFQRLAFDATRMEG